MIDKLLYAAAHYFALLLFLGASWGIGRTVLRRLDRGAAQSEADGALPWHGIAAAFGIGLYIYAMQLLAVAGQLRLIPVAATLVLGLCLCVLEWRALPARSGPSMTQRWHAANWTERGTLLLFALLLLPTLIDPLGPPLAWDEVQSHLPHALQWVLNGRLGVNDWLRTPWHPFNTNLLFSAAMIVYDDVMPHLINALAAWLCAALVYLAGKRYAGQSIATIAAIILLSLVRNEFDGAMLDTSVMLFVFAGCLAFHQWQQQPQRGVLLAAAAFLLGVAAGSKYQALQVLPLMAVALLIRTRAPRNWLIATVSLLLPCAYWYVRNYVMTGDPFNPIGGKVFGFSDWNLADYQFQIEDVKRNAGMPSWVIWPALLAPLIAKVRRLPGAPGAMIFAGTGLAVWLLTSRYPRYLMPFYPVLALLAAAVWHCLFVTVCSRFGGGSQSRLQSRAAAACIIVALLAVLPFALKRGGKSWKMVAPTAVAREAILQREITGYPVLAYLREHPMGRTYQFGLEESLYYAPQRTGGDHFGPGRYRDFGGLAPADLSKALRHAGYSSLLIHTERWPGISTQPGFAQFFRLVHQAGPVSLYQIGEPLAKERVDQ
ncbi:Dolichyl-phosphate-mannose-protein mannosyltransferase [Duganella sp. CF458]|uniref:glycosyltransferase family 39 protein n=1 Tax=Duganella sp. CF458 TaxID=1884368 RepID=UPI0008EE41DC|nr:glycosyltransferase family 39 protein [Duganella sp. CF458]SFG21360.1 Dolichyl-phosphate-mannose-protein mannosyltransferase [Duganella sp. CF458]